MAMKTEEKEQLSHFLSPSSPRFQKSSTSSSASSSPLSSRPSSALSSSRHPPITDAETAHYRAVFSLFDTHSIGFIPTSSVGFVLRSLRFNPTEAQIALLLNRTDHDGSGLLSFPAFHQMLRESRHELGTVEDEEAVLRLWDVFDVYREGRLPVRQLVSVLSEYAEALSVADMEALISEMDVDGDGLVDLKAFVSHMFQSSALH
jgi:Ca2+-binding EF-hand superfamily protein